jgi:hypothetical protein
MENCIAIRKLQKLKIILMKFLFFYFVWQNNKNTLSIFECIWNFNSKNYRNVDSYDYHHSLFRMSPLRNSQQFGNEKSALIFNLVNQKYYWKIFLDGWEWDWREELILAIIHSFIYSRTSLLTPDARKEISNFYFFHRFHRYLD